MICVSIAQTSHRMALVDILNAAPQCDLIEIRLDRLEKTAEIKELLQASTKPAIVSCRRACDGGDWSGSEENRLSLLRQAILDKAAYVEIEMDVASQIRRYGSTKRIIAYTNMSRCPAELEELYREMGEMDPDVIKITVPARNPQEAWPMLRLVAKGGMPTVAVGLGKNGVMLNILGMRYKAPWTYAALEKGMEAYPGMATIGDLDDIYDYKAIDGKTPLLAVTGFSEEQIVTSRVLNHGFKLAGNKTRCLPLEMSEVGMFAKICKAIKLAGLVVDDSHREQIVGVCPEQEETVKISKAADFIATYTEPWRAFNTTYRAVVNAIDDACKAKHPDDNPFDGRTYVIVGVSGTARSIAAGLRKKGAKIVIADRDNARSQAVAHELEARYIPSGSVYTVMCDGMILCRDDRNPKAGQAAIDTPKGCARPNMLGVDLTNFPYTTPFLDELRVLGGIVVKPSDIFRKMMLTVLRAYTGQTFTPEQLDEPMSQFDFDELPRMNQ